MILVNLAALAWLAVAAPPASEVAGLTAPQKEIVRSVAGDEFCGCHSALTLAGCLDKRPDCGLARTLEGILARAVRTGAGRQACANFMSAEVVGPLCAPPAKLAVDGAPTRGPADATTTVIEFADFRCTHCRAMMPMVERAVAAAKVRLIYAPISLQDAAPSTLAAEAAMAAHAQGKFWPMHAGLFAREAGDFDRPVVDAIARKVGLDMKRFARDLDTHRHAATIAGYRRAAFAAGLEGTPTFFVNGRRFTPTPDIFELSTRLTLEQQRDGEGCN